MCAIGVNAGEKGSFWKQSETEGGSAQRWLERRDAPMSGCPNIATLGSTYIEVNKWQRLKVATSQRRDVSASSASQSLNAKRGREFGGSEIEERTN